MSANSPTPGSTDGEAGRNWAGNHVYRAGRYVRPSTLEQAQQVIAESDRVRLLGSRHSFNALCDTDGTLLDLTGLPPEITLDEESSSVTVTGGTAYRDLAAFLEPAGYALPNMGSLPHISVAGASSTGTHGSGSGNRILGAGVRALELIGADGELRVVRRGEEGFDGSVVALGALGAVARMELDVEPTYLVSQDIWDHLSWSEAVERVGDILPSAYSVSVFGRWNDQEPTEVLVKSRVSPDSVAVDWAAGTAPIAADAPFRLLPGENHLTLRGEPGPWSERLPHFRGDQQPSFGAEIQTEWFVDAADAVGALRAVTALSDSLGGELQALLSVTEIRAIRGDDLWLSPAHGRETVALHFTWKRDPEAVLAMAKRIEQALAPYAARPHWGKVYDRLDLDLYPRLGDFRALAERVDPAHTFRNEMVDRVLG